MISIWKAYHDAMWWLVVQMLPMALNVYSQCCRYSRSPHRVHLLPLDNRWIGSDCAKLNVHKIGIGVRAHLVHIFFFFWKEEENTQTSDNLLGRYDRAFLFVKVWQWIQSQIFTTHMINFMFQRQILFVYAICNSNRSISILFGLLDHCLHLHGRKEILFNIRWIRPLKPFTYHWKHQNQDHKYKL